MRPLLIADRLDTLRAALTTTHAAQWRRLSEQCDWYRRQHPPAEHPTASITYFGPAAANLALAYRLTGQRGYLDEAWRWIGACIAYPHWGKAHMPDHDLDAGWLLHGLSLAYTWIGDDLDPARTAALRAKLELQGQRLFDFAVESEGRWWSSSYWQNHHWICHTGLATAGYALDRPEWTQRALDGMRTVLAEMPADGSDAEGVVYWRYGVPWLAVYADLVEHCEGVDLWKHGDFLANTFTWRLHQCAPGFEENADHGDCHDRRSGHSVALYAKLASVYRIGEAQWLAQRVADRHFWREAYASGVKPGVMPEAYLELLWHDPDVVAIDPATTTPTTAYFPDLGQVVARTGWDDRATFVSFKAAPGGGHHAWQTAEKHRRERGWQTLNAGHHHPDAGAFLLASHGAFLAVDEGYSSRKRAAHHNTILVDGHGWAGEDRYNVYHDLPFEAQPRLRDVLAAGGFAHATAEVAAMFDPALGVRRHDRTLVVTPTGRTVLWDELAADAPRTWTLLLHSDWPAEITGGRVVLRSGPGQACVSLLHGPQHVEQATTEVEANPTSSTPS
ncbi:MAG: hypothetical protein HOV94_05210, partial [Saccharothrix sp.]|nr:hypothetical protein [Saccharothrix sp.]